MKGCFISRSSFERHWSLHIIKRNVCYVGCFYLCEGVWYLLTKGNVKRMRDRKCGANRTGWCWYVFNKMNGIQCWSQMSKGLSFDELEVLVGSAVQRNYYRHNTVIVFNCVDGWLRTKVCWFLNQRSTYATVPSTRCHWSVHIARKRFFHVCIHYLSVWTGPYICIKRRAVVICVLFPGES